MPIQIKKSGKNLPNCAMKLGPVLVVAFCFPFFEKKIQHLLLSIAFNLIDKKKEKKSPNK
jgi:hypothetical protein